MDRLTRHPTILIEDALRRKTGGGRGDILRNNTGI